MHASQQADPKLRIQILTSSTGGGHDSRSYSLKGWIEHLAPDQAEVRVVHLLEDSSWLPRFGVNIYNLIQRHAPALHNIYWHIAEGFAWIQGKRLTFGREHYVQLLEEFRPDLIVSMHDCLNRGYFSTAKTTLGPSVKCCTYCGEWSGGFGYSRNWVDPTVDLFISRTHDAERHALSLGVLPHRSIIFRNLLPECAFNSHLNTEERYAFLENELKLDSRRFTVLLATGQVGANNHLRILRALESKNIDCQVIAMCGRNPDIAVSLKAWKQEHPAISLHIEEGFSHRVPQLLQVSDCVVSRGGANTTAEALFFGCPIIFNKMGGVMPQERLTLKYFTSHGAGAEIGSESELAGLIDQWSKRGPSYNSVKQSLARLRSNDHPSELVQRLLDLASDAKKQ